MKSPTAVSAWTPYIPTLLISISILIVAGVLGGPIAAAISAFAVLPSLLSSGLITFLVLKRYSPSSNYSALGLGFGLYVAASIIVLLCLNAFGPSQIM